MKILKNYRSLSSTHSLKEKKELPKKTRILCEREQRDALQSPMCFPYSVYEAAIERRCEEIVQQYIKAARPKALTVSQV